jgi:aminoglycoside/choline kinase family phosphotransferase
LIHGDSHLANVFAYATPAGSKMGMLDFQAVQWSKGIRDVQYFLIHSLDPELLGAHERSLVDHYVEACEARGVTLDRNQTFEHYRAFSFQTLSTAFVALGLGSLTERNTTVGTVLDRSIAAARRLDLPGFLGSL